jgi:hypothetical protein
VPPAALNWSLNRNCNSFSSFELPEIGEVERIVKETDLPYRAKRISMQSSSIIYPFLFSSKIKNWIEGEMRQGEKVHARPPRLGRRCRAHSHQRSPSEKG